MNPGEIANTFVVELLWNAAAFFVTALFSIVVMRVVFGLGLTSVIHEVEEEHNAGVGAAFFTISLITSLWLGKVGGDFSGASSAQALAAWSLFGFVIATLVFLTAYNLIFRIICHRKGEGMIAYLRREAIVENNAAMILFVASLAIPPYILAAMITV